MKYGCLFSGVGCSTLAFAPLGWECAFHAEVDPFASAVLRHHWPETPNLGDITAVDWASKRGTVDLLMGSPPCQSFSVAGRRKGTADARGSLSLSWAGIVNAVDPLWSITENVPGWLTLAGNDFGAFLGALVGGGAVQPPGNKWRTAGVVVGPARAAAWRVLDAQHFGVPQRRRRLFVVTGRAGSGADPIAVLFERAGNRGDCAEGEEEREGAARASDGGAEDRIPLLADPITANEGNCYAHAGNNAGRLHNVIPTDAGLRRLTPRECNRVQGMPDDHVAITYRGKPAADRPRYRAVGNGIAVPVLRWIGERINRRSPSEQSAPPPSAPPAT